MSRARFLITVISGMLFLLVGVQGASGWDTCLGDGDTTAGGSALNSEEATPDCGEIPPPGGGGGGGGGGSAPPPAQAKAPIGWLDAVSGDGVAYGWTCDPDDYAAAVSVHFYYLSASGDFSFVGAATADGAREAAVADACGGHARHGFGYSLPESVRDGRQHHLYAYAIDAGGGHHPLLSGSPKPFTLHSAPEYDPNWAEGTDEPEGFYYPICVDGGTG